jgi:hypothetical protein
MTEGLNMNHTGDTVKVYTPKDGTPTMQAIQQAIALADDQAEPVTLRIKDREATVQPGSDELDVWHRCFHGEVR